MNMAVAVGFVALAGVAAETGVIMLIYLDHALTNIRQRRLLEIVALWMRAMADMVAGERVGGFLVLTDEDGLTTATPCWPYRTRKGLETTPSCSSPATGQ